MSMFTQETIKKNFERGQSFVELALTLTFLLVLLAGILDIGRVLFVFIEMNDAAEEGTIYGALNPTDTIGIESRVRDYAEAPVDLSDSTAVQVAINTIGGTCAGHAIEVTVSYDFTLATPFLGTIIGSQSIPINVDSLATIIRPPC